jgi:hypothetical protein
MNGDGFTLRRSRWHLNRAKSTGAKSDNCFWRS